MSVSSRSVAFNLTPAAKPAAAAAAPAVKRRAAVVPPKLVVPPPRIRVTPPSKSAIVGVVPLTKAEFAASDIGALPSRKGAGDAGSGGTGEASARGDGPGGAPLYNAEWYVEPSHAALAPYLKNGTAPGSWATVACKTIERYHVENCVGLGESPPGSGLARALRLASWQFLVRPPRIDGRPLIGSWVRIRFDWTDKDKG